MVAPEPPQHENREQFQQEDMWRKVQSEKLHKAIFEKGQPVIQTDFSAGLISGRVWAQPGVKYRRAAIVVHGTLGNRTASQSFIERLVRYGLLTVSIDMPYHGDNTNTLHLGTLSETIIATVKLVQSSYGITNIVVIGHSFGGVGTLLASSGFTRQIEQNIFAFNEKMSQLTLEIIRLKEKMQPYLASQKSQTPLTETQTDVIKQFHTQLQKLILDFEKVQAETRKLILDNIVQNISVLDAVKCYVLLAPPKSLVAAIPGFRHAGTHAADALYNMLHVFSKSKQDNTFEFHNLRITNLKEFIEYFMSMNETEDYLDLLDKLVRIAKKDGKISIYEYYRKKYIQFKPKLFLYGHFDQFLRPFFGSSDLRKFYERFGDGRNVLVKTGWYTHFMHDSPLDFNPRDAVDSTNIALEVLTFIDEHMA